MKKIFLILVFVILQVITINAQRGFSSKERVKELKEKLGLTDIQVKKIEAIFDKNQEKIDSRLKSVWKITKQWGNKYFEMIENSDKEILKLLDDKQKAEYKKLIKERRENREERMSPPPPDRPYDDDDRMPPPPPPDEDFM